MRYSQDSSTYAIFIIKELLYRPFMIKLFTTNDKHSGIASICESSSIVILYKYYI